MTNPIAGCTGESCSTLAAGSPMNRHETAGHMITHALDTSDFPARWYCGTWTAELGWMHILSDIAIFGAYLSIPVVLGVFLLKRKDLELPSTLWLFVGFILFCGIGHLIEAVIFWFPVYRLAGLVKLLTAAISWVTVLAIAQLLPKLLQLPVHVRVQRDRLDSLERDHATLVNIVDKVPYGIFWKDQDSRFLGCNRAFARTLSISHPDECIGKTAAELGCAEQECTFHRNAEISVMESGEPILRLTEPVYEDEELRYRSTCTAPYTNERGDVIGVLGVTTDITDLKEMEEQRRVAELANQMKTRFLANMSHEIRTPLNAILGYTELMLKRERELPTESCGYLRTIRSSGSHLLRVIDDVLDLAKVEEGAIQFEFASVSPAKMIHEVERVLAVQANHKQLAFGCRWPSQIPETIRTDEHRVMQVLINVVANAIKFTRSGSVEVETRWKPETLTITVRDTGIGIPPDKLNSIFVPFEQADTSTTRKFGGTGLGLAISKQIVEQLGGTLTVQSTPGTGTEFAVQLPTEPNTRGKLVDVTTSEPEIPEQQPVGVSDPLPVPAMNEQTARILIVDDAEVNRDILRLFLDELGYEVVSASDGAEAIELAADTSFDLILMDLHMPVLDGQQTTKYLRSDGCEATIIAFTADALNWDRDRCLENGFDDYATKPVEFAELLELVNMHLSQRAESSQRS